NTLTRTYPRGMDTEVFSYKVLQEVYYNAQEQPEREHVTPYICWHPERYKLDNVSHHENQSHHRWTVDTPEDFELIKLILQDLYPVSNKFTWLDVLNLLNEHPEWVQINASVTQKEI
ncbi:MAG: acylneuraminate cytidylyltransferase, partial [Syntrophomonadaceae bacterium]|nr:acylneuraminate cytidylyltransferase [Syntrophomonadaceae bacterium]